jgi:hypothetical protein
MQSAASHGAPSGVHVWPVSSSCDCDGTSSQDRHAVAREAAAYQLGRVVQHHGAVCGIGERADQLPEQGDGRLAYAFVVGGAGRQRGPLPRQA